MSPRRPNQGEQRSILLQMQGEVESLLAQGSSASLRERVRAIARLRHLVFDYGASFFPDESAGRARILAYFKQHMGDVIDSEELAVVSGIQEFPRRIRELRTQEGWVIATKLLGRPDIGQDQYVLETLEKSDPHTRSIPEAVAEAVFKRDGYRCVRCHWSPESAVPGDRRYFELHHRKQHVQGGLNTEENLEVRCNVCHKQAHTK